MSLKNLRPGLEKKIHIMDSSEGWTFCENSILDMSLTAAV